MNGRRIGAVARFVAAAAVLRRLSRGRRRRAPLVARAGRMGAVSVVVPARNEAARIAPCLECVTADPAVSEVVVVDDRSDDGTGDLARSLGARVVEGAPLPEGWIGKQWALQQGIEAARHEFVVTLDADTRVRSGLVGAVVERLGEADLVSVAPRFVCRNALLRWLHPSMLATLTYRFGPLGADGPGPPPHRAIGNGQCLGARREALLRSEVLHRTRAHMTDDIALVRLLAAERWRVSFVDGADLLSVEMYASAAEAWREWPRTLAMADVTSSAWKVLDSAVLALVMAAPVLRVATGRSGPLDWGLLALRVALLGALARFYERRGLAFWLSPLADPVAVGRLVYATLRPVRTWRGRSYALEG